MKHSKEFLEKRWKEDNKIFEEIDSLYSHFDNDTISRIYTFAIWLKEYKLSYKTFDKACTEDEKDFMGLMRIGYHRGWELSPHQKERCANIVDKCREYDKVQEQKEKLRKQKELEELKKSNFDNYTILSDDELNNMTQEDWDKILKLKK